MPVYNASRFLREAIDSILAQSFRPFEFLIIDDGSTDDSADIIRSYSDPRIRFVPNEVNRGITATLNQGIALASCDLIARMDADDISYPQRLQKQFGYMRRNPTCAMLSTWARVVREDGSFVRLERYRSGFYYYNLTFECWIYHPTVMFRKSALEEIGMYRIPYAEDYDLFWRMSTRFPIANLAEALVDYRLSPGSLNAVLKKDEYARATEENVLRNIRYYMGEDFTISPASLECLRHNFQPMLAHYDPACVLDTLRVLEVITERILRAENPNRDARAIRRAHHFKRRFILTELSQSLPVVQACVLLIRSGALAVLFSRVRKEVKAFLRRQINAFRNSNHGTRLRTSISQAVKNT